MRLTTLFSRHNAANLVLLVLLGCSSDELQQPAGSTLVAEPADPVMMQATELPPAEPELRLPTAAPLPAARGAAPEAADFVRRKVNVKKGSNASSIELSAIELLFDPGTRDAALNEFHQRPGLQSLTLNADVVRIVGRLWLPQTNLTIRARQLIFEDIEGSEQPSHIDTTALPHGPLPKNAHKNKPGDPGAQGKSAGNVVLIVDELLPVPALPEPPARITPAPVQPTQPVQPSPPVNPERAYQAGLATLQAAVEAGDLGKEEYVERQEKLRRQYKQDKQQYRRALQKISDEDLQRRSDEARRLWDTGAIDKQRYKQLMQAIELGEREPAAAPPKPLSAPLRFRLDGQPGQAGGRGAHGEKGQDASYNKSWRGQGKTKDKVFKNVVYYERAGLSVISEGKTVGGTIPTKGGNAVSGGKPGNGGNGGQLFTNLAVDNIALVTSQQAGAAGPVTPAYAGGREGWPSTWQHIKGDGFNVWLVKEGTTKQGNGKPARRGKPGQPGAIKPASDTTWLTPQLVAIRSAYAREAYLAGHHETARQICVDHLRAAAQQPWVRNNPKTASDHRDLLIMARRLRSGLDYFGNPAGWAPMLSLETTIDTYRAGINEAVRLLAVTTWAERQWGNLKQRKRSLSDAIKLQQGRIEQLLQANTEARQALPLLRSELDKIDTDTARFLALLEGKERRISSDFANDEEMRQLAIDALGAIKSGIEIAAFSGAGGAAAAGGMVGLTFVESQLQPDKPTLDSDSTTAALNSMLAADDQASARKRFLSMGVGTDDSAAFLAELQDLSAVLADATRQQITASVTGGVNSEAGARLEDLKNADPEFAQYFNEVIELATYRKMLIIKVAEAMDRLDRLADGVADARESIATLSDARDQAGSLIDEPAQKALTTMSQQARERLMLYKYYVAKAWEYRMLKPAAVDYRENRLFEKVAALRKQDGDWSYANESAMYQDLKAIYEADLNNLVSQLVRDLAERRNEAVRTERRLTLRDHELQRLNRDGVVEIPLDPRVVLPSDRNSRLAYVAVDTTATRITGSGDETYMEVTFEPTDWSVLEWADEAYLFHYGLKREANLVRWGFSWNDTNQLTPFDSSGDDAALLALAGNVSDRLRFRPGARSRLIVRRELQPATADVNISSLALTLTVDKHKARSAPGIP